MYDVGGIFSEMKRNKLYMVGDGNGESFRTSEEQQFIDSVDRLLYVNNIKHKNNKLYKKLIAKFGSICEDDQLLRVTANESGLNIVTTINKKNHSVSLFFLSTNNFPDFIADISSTYSDLQFPGTEYEKNGVRVGSGFYNQYMNSTIGPDLEYSIIAAIESANAFTRKENSDPTSYEAPDWTINISGASLGFGIGQIFMLRFYHTLRRMKARRVLVDDSGNSNKNLPKFGFNLNGFMTSITGNNQFNLTILSIINASSNGIIDTKLYSDLGDLFVPGELCILQQTKDSLYTSFQLLQNAYSWIMNVPIYEHIVTTFSNINNAVYDDCRSLWTFNEPKEPIEVGGKMAQEKMGDGMGDKKDYTRMVIEFVELDIGIDGLGYIVNGETLEKDGVVHDTGIILPYPIDYFTDPLYTFFTSVIGNIVKYHSYDVYKIENKLSKEYSNKTNYIINKSVPI
jgi:hypothetical protein